MRSHVCSWMNEYACIHVSENTTPCPVIAHQQLFVCICVVTQQLIHSIVPSGMVLHECCVYSNHAHLKCAPMEENMRELFVKCVRVTMSVCVYMWVSLTHQKKDLWVGSWRCKHRQVCTLTVYSHTHTSGTHHNALFFHLPLRHPCSVIYTHAYYNEALPYSTCSIHKSCSPPYLTLSLPASNTYMHAHMLRALRVREALKLVVRWVLSTAGAGSGYRHSLCFTFIT